jgi:cytochrome c-type biogenesis protein CcmH
MSKLGLLRKLHRASREMRVAIALIGACSTPVLAVQPGEQLMDPALEARARAISGELRCLVCQNQSIDDSDAPLAKDLRLLLREQLKKGLSDDEAKQFLVARYGDFVLLRPPLKLATLALWGAPFLALAAGGVAVAVAYRRRNRPAAPIGLNPNEMERLRQLGVEDSGEK